MEPQSPTNTPAPEPSPVYGPASQPTPPRRKLPSLPLKLALLMLAGIAVLLVGLFTLKPGSSPKPGSQDPATQRTIEVEITKDGFVPATVSIPTGTKVTWVNRDDNPHQVASNPHPEHTSTPGLDSKDPLGPGSSYSYTFDKPGTSSYHDHQNPVSNGTVVVE